MESTELAWAAGFWDGEGSVCLLKPRSHAGYFVAEAAVTRSSSEGRPEVLERLAVLVGGGYWYGPYMQPPPCSPVYRWKLFRREEIRKLFDLLWPWLGPVEREQATALQSSASPVFEKTRADDARKGKGAAVVPSLPSADRADQAIC